MELKEKKEVYWSRFASDFEEKNNYVVGKHNMKALLYKVSECQNLGKVLELGCGNGTYTRALLDNADHITTTDFSDEMIKEAKVRLKKYDNIHVEKANCFSLQYEDHSFDTVFMANLLHIIPDHDLAIKEASRVLKRNGQLIILSFTVEQMSTIQIMKMMYRYIKTYGKPSPHAKKLFIKDFSNSLEDLGFCIQYADILGNDMKALFIKATKEF